VQVKYSDGNIAQEICGKVGFEDAYTIDLDFPMGRLKSIEMRIDEDSKSITGIRLNSEIDSS